MSKKTDKGIQLKDLLTGKQFEKIEATFRRNFGLSLESTDLAGREVFSFCSSATRPMPFRPCSPLTWSGLPPAGCCMESL